MCGISGVASLGLRNARSTIERMTDIIAHRGPDGHGYYVDENAALGHRRLSIIDVAGGSQPMSNESGDQWLVYNGEIFNHAELRPELERAGHRYVTRCDSETIVHAFEQYGPACVERFRGMFAVAIYDRREPRLILVRDRLGIKPLYYFWDGRLFAFASEIKALLEHPEIGARLESSLLPEYLAFGYTNSDQTLFAGIRKLMPGHHLTLSLGDAPRLDIRQYWDVPRPSQFEQRSDADYIKECRARLEETVQMRLMSDVPLGMFLSGGVDSSAIAALMKRMVSSPVQSFSVGYREAAYSELGYARQVADAIQTDHHEVTLGMEEFFNALPKMVWHEDEPIAWPSSVSLYFVSKLAAHDVKVVLTGEGSDELFGGYERYGHYLFNARGLSAYRAVPAPLRKMVRDGIAATTLLNASSRRKLRHTFLGREDNYESLQLDNFYCAFSAEEQRTLFGAHPPEPSAIYGNYLKYWHSDGSVLGNMLYADMKTYLVELLMKQDQMSMACSLESRVPFLDHPFVEFAASVPPELKIRNGERKYIFKKAVEDLLPHDIVYRKKMGFPTPLRSWLLEDRAAPLYAMLRAPDGLIAEHLDMDAVDALLTRHQSGVEDATDRIWRLLNLQLWGDAFLSGKRHENLVGQSAFPAPH